MNEEVKDTGLWTKGTLVVFLGENGWPGELKHALQKFTKGEVLVVDTVTQHNWSTDVTFQDVDGTYNSVMFEEF